MGSRQRAGAARHRYVHDPLSGSTAELRQVQPVDARKVYRCPGCNQEIAIGLGHVVVVPLHDPAGRRHWHASCWDRRQQRPPH